MTTKKTKAVAKPAKLANKEVIDYRSKFALLPNANAAAVIETFGKNVFGEQDFKALAIELRSRFNEVEKGDLQHCEQMLVGQAHALQSIFSNLARLAMTQEHLPQFDTFLRLALKAQNQSRATIETLSAIKNPPVVFAKQANINHGGGNQQVNNGTPVPASHTRKNINRPNELLEVQHGGETVDSKATGNAIGKDQAMATVG